VINPGGTIITSTLLMPITIKALNTGPPYFNPALMEITIEAGSEIPGQFNFLPDTIKDPDSSDKGRIIDVDFKGLSWISFASPKLSFQPGP
jgi:hypothetical protein